MNKSELVAIREYLLGDRNFILATWLRGLYYGDTWFREIPKDLFMENYHRVLEALLSKSSVKVRVACLKDDPEVILGYAVVSPGELHWLFVKSAWRGIGIAKSLVPEDTHTVTHLTKVGLGILKRYPGQVIFNPFSINYLK